MKKKTVLVTGASGFLGHNVVALLLKKNYRIRAVVREDGHPFGSKVTYYRADLLEGLPQKALEGVEAIVHLAGEIDIGGAIKNPRTRFEHNTAMLMSVLEAARLSQTKPLVIFASTDQMYGQTKQKIVDEEAAVSPLEPYTASKIICETLLKLYAHLYEVPYIVLRLSSMYGPHQPRVMFISDIIQKMLTSEHITTGPLTSWKRFLYVEDAARAVLAALAAKESARNQIYNIAGETMRMQDACDMIQETISKRFSKKITVGLDPAFGRPQKTDIGSYRVSSKKAEKMLGFKTGVKPKEGFAKTIAFFEVARR